MTTQPAPICGNKHTEDGYYDHVCQFPPGHGPVPVTLGPNDDIDGVAEHGDPDRGAWWSHPAPMTPASAPVGTQATIGHPGNGRYIIKGDEGWFYRRNGSPVNEEDFRAGWDVVSLPADTAAVLAERDELREKIAYLRAGILDLEPAAIIERVTAVGSAEWQAGAWLAERIAAERAEAVQQALSKAAAQPSGADTER
jgi:hypothetical protein